MATWNVIHYTDIRPDRCDAEYFQPLYNENIKKLTMSDFVRLASLFSVIDRGEKAEYNESGNVPVLRSVNIRDLSFSDQRQEFVTEDYYSKKTKGQVHKDDILITSTGTGTLGRTSIWYKDSMAFNVPENSFLRGPLNVNPYFIATFLSTKFGVLQLFQNQRGSSGQLHLYPVDIKRVVIPSFILDYQNEIGDTIKKAFVLEEESKSLYYQAEELLAKELQLDQLKLLNKKWYSTQYGEVLNRLRSDAEFYNPKLAQYYEHFSHIGLDMKCICDFVKVKKFSNPTYAKEGLPIITQRHLSVISPENYGDFPIADPNWCNKNTEAVLKKEDLLYYSVGAYLGKTNVWLNDDNAVFASFITLMRCKDVIDSCFLMLLLNSPFGILQSKVFQSGTSQPYIYPKDIKQFLVPDITRKRKEALFDLIHKSYSAMNQSKQLLAQAKHRVEELIEQEANKYK